jgi:hypothetical protein
MVELLPSKCKVLSSKSTTAKVLNLFLSFVFVYIYNFIFSLWWGWKPGPPVHEPSLWATSLVQRV